MADLNQLLRDIRTFRDSLGKDWLDLCSEDLDGDDRREVIRHAEWCAHELNELLVHLDDEKQGSA